MGLLKPTNGELELDGVAILTEDLPRYRSLFGYVPQETFIANDTVKNNIAFGLPADQICNDRVKHYAKIAEIDTFITSHLDSGYETLLILMWSLNANGFSILKAFNSVSFLKSRANWSTASIPNFRLVMPTNIFLKAG